MKTLLQMKVISMVMDVDNGNVWLVSYWDMFRSSRVVTGIDSSTIIVKRNKITQVQTGNDCISTMSRTITKNILYI